MKLLIFTEGTIIMHTDAKGNSREEIIRQSRKAINPSLRDWKTYIPIGNSLKKLQTWKEQGAEILYLTSRTTEHEVAQIKEVLIKNGFPEGQLFFRKPGEHYGLVAERILPNILIEDDCESIGGKKEMVYTHIKPHLQKKITLIVVREFEGIDHLPDDISNLITSKIKIY